MAQDGLHPPAPKARPRQQRKAFYPKKIKHPSSPPAGGKWDSKGTSPFGAARAGLGVQRAKPFGAARAGPGVQRAEPFGPAQVCETARFVKKFAFPQDSCRSPLAIFRFTLYTNKIYRKLSRKK